MDVLDKIDLIVNEEKKMHPGTALRSLSSMVDKIKKQFNLDVFWNEMSKPETEVGKIWAMLNDKAKKTLLKKVQDKEEELQK